MNILWEAERWKGYGTDRMGVSTLPSSSNQTIPILHPRHCINDVLTCRLQKQDSSTLHIRGDWPYWKRSKKGALLKGDKYVACLFEAIGVDNRAFSNDVVG